jgi:hypothetical protein
MACRVIKQYWRAKAMQPTKIHFGSVVENHSPNCRAEPLNCSSVKGYMNYYH